MKEETFAVEIEHLKAYLFSIVSDNFTIAINEHQNRITEEQNQ